ncbi:phenylalanyl-tRNA synthetase beta chain [Cryptosporidium ryanae]|uniref:phenylalanyl-tRNA synthetase beta chain n=1 Tax=Cryptosporidium ryanae TaxID=515981 RepID=UPI00351A193E|nr:phenylalanyl-tRNA synthetase beta chain [Cryptosporidium ryanae]
MDAIKLRACAYSEAHRSGFTFLSIWQPGGAQQVLNVYCNLHSEGEDTLGEKNGIKAGSNKKNVHKMPVVSVSIRVLESFLNRNITEEWLDDICFQYGLELDGTEVDETNGDRIAKIEIPANRPDILCLEGLVIALRCFIGDSDIPKYVLGDSKERGVRMIVKKPTSSIRPFVLCAVLRDIEFNEDNYKSFIDFQEKLHHNICRKRSLASIGTHDLDKIRGPFYYDAKPHDSVRFVPLVGNEELNGTQLLDFLGKHQQLRHYVPLVTPFNLLPVITDSNKTVLSVPPLINGDHSKITLETKNVFIEVTATDYSRAHIVLNQIVSSFSLYCKKQFEIEPVVVEYEHDVYPPHPYKYKVLESGNYEVKTPCIDDILFDVNVTEASKLLGITPPLNAESAKSLLKKMMISSETQGEVGEGTLKCRVPINRSDVLHPVDLFEDIGISYGYNKIVKRKFDFCELDRLNLGIEIVKRELSTDGVSEAQNWALCKHSDCFEYLLREEDIKLENSCIDSVGYDLSYPAVVLKNAKTSEFEIVRTTLIQSLLKTMESNKSLPLPQRVFEVGDVVILDKSTPSGSRNDKRVAIAYSNASGSGLEEIHGFLDHLLNRLGLIGKYSLQDANSVHPNCIGIYHLKEVSDPTFLPTRCVKIVIQKLEFDNSQKIELEKTYANQEVQIGIMGVVHPSVLNNFNLTLPTSILEIRLEPIFKWWPETLFYNE